MRSEAGGLERKAWQACEIPPLDLIIHTLLASSDCALRTTPSSLVIANR